MASSSRTGNDSSWSPAVTTSVSAEELFLEVAEFVASSNRSQRTNEDILSTCPLEVLRKHPELRIVYDRGVMHGMLARNTILTTMAFTEAPIELVRAAQVLLTMEGAIGAAKKGLKAGNMSVTLAEGSAEGNAVNLMMETVLMRMKDALKATKKAWYTLQQNRPSPSSGHTPN